MSLTRKQTRKQKRDSDPCRRHKGNGQTDGGKIPKSKAWYEGPPYRPNPKQSGDVVGTIYSSKE